MRFEKTRCGLARRRLNAFIDGELSQRDRLFVSRHIERCSRCRGALDEIAMLEPLLRESDIPDIPEQLIGTVMSEARKRVHVMPTARFLRLERAFSRAAVIAALITGIATGLLFGWSAGRGMTASSVNADSGGVDIVVANRLDVFGAAPYGSIESAFIPIETGAGEGD